MSQEHRSIPPGKHHEKILLTLHEGHIDIVKMKNIAREYVWWPGVDTEIKTITNTCNECASTQPDPLKVPLHPWQWHQTPWQRIHVDLAGPFMNFMFFVVVDAHLKWTEIIPLSPSQPLKF
ncbi:polyprotein [Plakobranchus ocellatus]|uniref:Polyprotein n=1 Tax=Plakobranchus ocellatus TaxID=259542 RepID=A0AAV4DGQ0_9GAST|nr:polyprotein [Plakobranchus ocellatus]